MTPHLQQRLRSLFSIALLLCAWRPGAQADPTPVRQLVGTIHGFLEVRSEDGRVVASGDAIQVVHGDRVTAEAVFHFSDGSLDDETTVFTQRRNFQLISDHHVQKGPAFPHPSDVMIDVPHGQVTVRSTGTDGKEEVTTDHLDLPPDLANGLVPFVVENIGPNSAGSTVPYVALTPKPRLVKLAISRLDEGSFSVAGSPRKAIHYEIKVELGGIAGVVAPLIGKAPPDIQMWTSGGQAQTLVREQGPMYTEGPMMTIQLAGTAWTETPRKND